MGSDEVSSYSETWSDPKLLLKHERVKNRNHKHPYVQLSITNDALVPFVSLKTEN